MPKIVCPHCNGSGDDLDGGPCHYCGGSRTEKVGIFGSRTNVDKRGSGYIKVSGDPCPSCGGRGSYVDTMSDKDYANLHGEGKIARGPQTLIVKCSSCSGTGKVL